MRLTKWRIQTGWAMLGGCFGMLLLIGVLLEVDLERYQCDPARLGKLAATDSSTWTVSTDDGDWPQWRGPNRDGLSLETALLTSWPSSGPPVLWAKSIGRGFSSVVVTRGRLYTMVDDPGPETPGSSTPPGHYETVVCLDARTGKDIWRFRYPNRYEERFGGGPRSTPAVDGDFVYAVGPTGIFHCLRADTGKKVWRHDLLQEFQGRPMRYGVSFSPLVEGRLVYAMPGGPNGNSVAAFDKRTGALIWKALDDPAGYSSPVAVTAAGVRQVLFFTNTNLVSLSPKEGKVYWRYPWQTDNGFNIATPVAFGNYVIISSAYNKGCALLEITAQSDGSLQASRVYEHNRMRNHFASSVRFGDHLYGFDRMDLVCMELRTGRIVWREKGLRTFRKGSLLIADGRLLILGEDGTLTMAAATPTGYHQTAAFRVLENKCWTVPVLSNGRLYVRDESELVCLNMRVVPERR